MPMESSYQQLPSWENSAFVENIELDTLYIPENVTTEKINGENMQKFIRSLCMRNVPTYISGDTQILGVIIINVF